MWKYLILTAGVMGLLSNLGLAATKPTCAKIDAAISASEDFVEVALGTDTEALAEAQQAIHTSYSAISSALAPELSRRAEAAITSLDAAIATADIPKASLAAMDIYEILAKAFAQRLATTIETAMLDHAGFRIHGLVAEKTIQWEMVDATVAAAAENWKKIGKRISDIALLDLMQDIQSGLAKAAAARNAAWLASTAQILLDSVDLIEKFAKNTSREACS